MPFLLFHKFIVFQVILHPQTLLAALPQGIPFADTLYIKYYKG
jgi:hypothetical protein